MQKVSWESPGSYVATGETVIGATFLDDHISAVNGSNNVVLLGTIAKIDLTDYVAIHVIARRNSGNVNGCTVRVLNTKNVADYVVRGNVATSGSTYSEYVLDISSVTGEKYISLETSAYSMDFDVKEIWLTKS